MSVSQTSLRAEREHNFIEALDPRTRLIGAMALVVTFVSLHTFTARFAAIGLAVLLVAAARIEPRTVLRRLAHLEGFMILLLIMLPLTVPGEPLAKLGPLVVSDRGVERAFGIVLTVNAAALCVLALIGTLEPIRLGRALAALGVSERFVRLFMFVVRYHGIFGVEIRRQFESMRARGFRAGVGRHAFRSYGNLAGMILVRSIERAERVDEAMRCRGFSGRFPFRRVRPMTFSDARFAGVAGCAIVALAVLDRMA
ncbi:MAG: cobalt ECF transporter T component CbiQ [Beijerinckiaceae bacterium]